MFVVTGGVNVVDGGFLGWDVLRLRPGTYRLWLSSGTYGLRLRSGTLGEHFLDSLRNHRGIKFCFAYELLVKMENLIFYENGWVRAKARG